MKTPDVHTHPSLPEGVRVRPAVRADAPVILALVRGLADYEKLPPPDAEAEARLIHDMFSHSLSRRPVRSPGIPREKTGVCAVCRHGCRGPSPGVRTDGVVGSEVEPTGHRFLRKTGSEGVEGVVGVSPRAGRYGTDHRNSRVNHASHLPSPLLSPQHHPRCLAHRSRSTNPRYCRPLTSGGVSPGMHVPS